MDRLLEITFSLLGISLLIIAHESGHYLAARAFGMRVLRFSIGIGNVIAKWQPKGSPTTFQISAIPFLAYVQVDGMNPFEERDLKDPALFTNKGVFARIVTILAGPAANYLCASLIWFSVLVTLGDIDFARTPMRVDSVQANSPAAQSGVRAGDLFIAVEGNRVESFVQFRERSGPRAEQLTHYTLMRAGQRVEITMTPARGAEGRGIVGISPVPAYFPIAFGEAAERAVLDPFRYSGLMFEGFVSMLKRRSADQLSGPFGMIGSLSESVRKGALDFWTKLVGISVALGFFNLLPFPGLDGGRLIFLGYELITRKRPNEKFEAVINAAGVLFLLGVILLVSFRDVAAWFAS